MDQAELGRPDFSPSGCEWIELEKKIEKSLTEEDREFVANVINEYNKWHFAENTAVPVADCRAVVAKLKILIDESNEILTGSGPSKFDHNTLDEAKMLVFTNFKKIHPNHLFKGNHDDIINILYHLSTSCIMAGQELIKMDGNGLVEGESWCSMVNELRDYLSRAGFRTGASNSSLNNQPFVEFMMHLSKINCGPKEHTTSVGSLTKAILLAARKRK